MSNKGKNITTISKLFYFFLLNRKEAETRIAADGTTEIILTPVNEVVMMVVEMMMLMITKLLKNAKNQDSVWAGVWGA